MDKAQDKWVSDAAEAIERFGEDELERFAAAQINAPPDLPVKPECQLIGTDGNVFAIIGAVSRALRRAGQHKRAEEWKRQAMACESYDAVLGLVFEFVDPI